MRMSTPVWFPLYARKMWRPETLIRVAKAVVHSLASIVERLQMPVTSAVPLQTHKAANVMPMDTMTREERIV